MSKLAPKGMHYILLEYDKRFHDMWYIAESKDMLYLASLAEYIICNPKDHTHCKEFCLELLCVDD